MRVQLAHAYALLTEHAHRQDDEALSGRFARDSYPSRTARRLRPVERTVLFLRAAEAALQNRTIAGMAYATPSLAGDDQTSLVLPFYDTWCHRSIDPEGWAATLVARPLVAR